MPSTPSAPADGRRLLVYRVLVGVLLAALLAVAFVPRRASRPELDMIDVGAYARESVRQHPDWPDVVSKPFYDSSSATVHLHVMAPGQTCPLHLHETTQEATVVVVGSADVSFAHGKDGALVSRSERFPPGSVVYSPSYCGHEWANRGAVPLGNLVFTTPRFAGNRYVTRDEPLLLRGPEPILATPDDGAAGRRETVLPVGRGRTRLLSIDSLEEVAPGESATLVYVIRGEGTFESGASVALAPERLIVLRARRAARIRPRAGEHLRLVVMQPAEGEEL